MITVPILTKTTETWRFLPHSHRVAANTGNSSSSANVTWRLTLRPSLHVTFVQLASGNQYDLSSSISVKSGPSKTSRSQSRWSTEAETSDCEPDCSVNEQQPEVFLSNWHKQCFQIYQCRHGRKEAIPQSSAHQRGRSARPQSSEGEGRDLSGHQRTQTPTNSRKSRDRDRDREAARLVLAAADSEIWVNKKSCRCFYQFHLRAAQRGAGLETGSHWWPRSIKD